MRDSDTTNKRKSSVLPWVRRFCENAGRPGIWVHCDKLSGAPAVSNVSEQIQRMFSAENLLAGLTDGEALLDCRIALHPDRVLEQRFVAAEEGWTSQSLVLKPAHGIEYRVAIDARMLAFLSQCNGSRTLNS